MPITRRAVLATAPLAATSMLGGSAVAQGQTAPQGNTRQAPGFYRYKVGDIEVTAINDGFATRPLDGFVRNAELSQVQQAHAGGLPARPTALPITFTTLVLRQGGRLTLIDTGNGDMRRADLGHLDGELQRGRASTRRR